MVISLPRDANRIAVIGGTSSVDGVTPVAVYVDPNTHRLLVDGGGTGAVVSVNGQQGIVTLATDDISDSGQTNLYFTDARARSSLSLTTSGTSGAATYNSTTGVFNIPNYAFGSVTSIGTTAPITGGTITSTGTIGITQATTSTDGYLSSTDWNTFNGKQSALTFSQSLVNTAGTVTLVSDTASPGNNKFYGTDGSGTRAWNPSLIGSTNFTSTETWLGVGAGASSASTAATTLVGSDAGSNTSGSNLMTAIGSGAGQNAGSSIGLTALGYRAGYNSVGGAIGSSTFIGNGAGNGASAASNSIFIGESAGASDPVNNNSGGGASILIGNSTSTNNNKNSIALGTGATNTNPNQFLVAPAYTRFSMRGLDYIMPSAFGSAGTALVDIGGNGTLQWTTPNTLLDKILAAGATNSIDNGAFAQTWQWNSLAGQTAMTLSSNSTAAASSTQKLLGLSLSGTNATSNQTTTVASFSNTHIGTGSTNIGATFVASGGSVNIAATFVGNVGIGRLSAPEMLSIGQSGLGAQIGLYGNTSGVVTLKPAAAAGTWTLTVPTTAGNSGEVLTTDGSGVTSWVAPSTVGASGPDGSVQIAVSGTFSSSTAIIFDTVAETLRLENTSSNPQLFFKGGSASGGYLDAISSVSGLWNDFNDQPIAVFNESNNTHFLANNQFSHDGTNGLTYWGSTANGIYGVIDVPNTKLSLISTTGIVFDYSATTGTVFTFPTSDGSAGDVLTTDGTGGLSFLPAGSSSTITVGTTPVASGVDTYVLFDNAGTVGEYAISGTGDVAMTNSPAFTTPDLGTPSALVGTNITGTATGFTSGSTNALKSATTTVDVSSATAPTSGQVLTATSGTAATWQSPSGANTALSNLSSVAINTTLLPGSNDGAGLGSGTLSFSDLFLASGGIIGWNNSAVTITHAASKLTFQGGSSGYQFDSLIAPNSNDGAPLGSTSLSWSDLFLASGAVLNYANGNVLVTHSSGVLTVGTGDFRVTTAGTNSASVATNAGTQTLTNKRVTKRLVSVNAPGATPTTNTDNTDIAEFTGLAAAITSMTTNLSGTPVNGDFLEFIFLDNGTARAITWGSSFADGGLVVLPTTTVISTVLRVLVQYQTIASLNKWVCIAVA